MAVRARAAGPAPHEREHTAAGLGRELGLDLGYLSRLLRGFRKRGLVARTPSPRDGREALLSLTARGQRTFETLDGRARAEVEAMLARVTPAQRTRLTGALREVEGLLGARGPGGPPTAPLLLRPPRPGDLGWIVQRHGQLYAEEHGYDETFEALVAGIVAQFVERPDPRRERCWIAEQAGTNKGCVLRVRKSKTVARLRLLLVEPSSRGLGLGAHLVSECLQFARSAGYRRITLWTQSDLDPARRLYRRAGFRPAGKEPHHSFGRDIVAETWNLQL